MLCGLLVTVAGSTVDDHVVGDQVTINKGKYTACSGTIESISPSKKTAKVRLTEPMDGTDVTGNLKVAFITKSGTVSLTQESSDVGSEQHSSDVEAEEDQKAEGREAGEIDIVGMRTRREAEAVGMRSLTVTAVVIIVERIRRTPKIKGLMMEGRHVQLPHFNRGKPLRSCRKPAEKRN